MSTSVSSVVNHFPSAENGFTTTLASTVSSGATTVPLNSVAGYANGETAVFVVDPTDITKKQTFTGTIDTAGVQVTNVVWTAGTNQTHSGGATVVDYATATHISMMSKGILVEHTQAGRHVMTSPKVITDINDTNGNELIKLTATPSAINEVTLANAATGNNPSLTASGGDTNIGINMVPKGTGEVQWSGVGVSGPWVTWTPTLTNITLGNGTVVAKYKQIGKTIVFKFKFTMGSTSAMGSVPTFTLPVTAASGPTDELINGLNTIFDTSTGDTYTSAGIFNSTTVCRIIYLNVNAVFVNLSSTLPMAWATGDVLNVTGTYEAAS